MILQVEHLVWQDEHRDAGFVDLGAAPQAVVGSGPVANDG